MAETFRTSVQAIQVWTTVRTAPSRYWSRADEVLSASESHGIACAERRGSTKVLRLTGSEWTAVRSTVMPPAMQDVIDTTELGTFVAAGPLNAQPSISALLYRGLTVLLWAAVAALAAGLIRDYWRRRPRRTNPGA